MIKKHSRRGETSILAITVARRSSPAACIGCSSPYGFALAFRGAFRQTSVWLLHFAEMFAKRRFCSCTSRSVSPNVEVSPASCLGLSPLGEDLLQSAGDVRTPTKYLLQLAGDVRSPTMISCNLREMFVALQSISCNLWEMFVALQSISCNLREMFVPLQSISCNLREMFVALQ